MRRIVFFLVMVASILVVGCGGKKHDAAYYQTKIDSIHKADRLQKVRQFKESSGVYDDPIEQFFDTLQYRPLPIRSAGANIGRLGHFTDIPKSLASRLGYPVETPLKVLALPRNHGHRVLMLAEGPDSIAPRVSLVTLDNAVEPIDQLPIYQQKAEERGDNLVLAFNEYYITSDYEVTLVFAFIRQDTTHPVFESTRRYVLNADGYFDEVIVDL